MNTSVTLARPNSWAVRTAASVAALAVGAIGIVGFATAASADHGECVPADAVTHLEHTYTRTITQWASSSPGGDWTATGGENVTADAVLEYQAQKWSWNPGVGQKTDDKIGNPEFGSWEYKWFSHAHDASGNGKDWKSTGETRVAAPATVEYEYSLTETTGWLTESPGPTWAVSDTRTVTDTEAVTCAAPSPTLVADGFQFRPGDTVNLNAVDFLAGEDVEFVLNSTPVFLALSPANQAGTALATSVVIPLGAPAGLHTVIATGRSSARTASTTIEVLPAVTVPTTPTVPTVPTTPIVRDASVTTPTAVTEGNLAETGNEALVLLGFAGSLTLAGAGLVGMRRASSALI